MRALGGNEVGDRIVRWDCEITENFVRKSWSKSYVENLRNRHITNGSFEFLICIYDFNFRVNVYTYSKSLKNYPFSKFTHLHIQFVLFLMGF